MAQLLKQASSKWYLYLGALTAYIYFRMAPLQVDPHHDGVILGAAIAVAEGHPVLAGAFSQYGPLPALIQGFALWLFNTQLLTLRLMTAVQCLVIGFSIYKLARQFAQENLSKLLSFFWLLTSCIWVTQFPGALLPWPSLLSTMFVMFGMIMIIDSANKSNLGLAFASGTLFGLAGFSRIQAFVLLPLIFVFGVLKYRNELKVLISSLMGYFSSLGVMVLYLLAIGSMDDFIQQGIITPLFFYSGAGQGNNYNRFQFALYLIEAVGFICLYLFAKRITTRIQSNFLFTMILTLVLFATCNLGIWVANSSIPIRYRVLIGEPLQNLIVSPFYFAILSSIFLVVLIFFKNGKREYGNNFAEAIVIFTAFGTLPQLYPQPDVMHLWWIAPIYLCCILILLKKISGKFSLNSSKILSTILVSCIFLGIISAFQYINRPWTEYKMSVLRGTFADEEKVRSLDMFSLIEKVAVAGQTSFDCPDGIYSVANGTYLAPDQWFVNWGFGDGVQPKMGTIRVICDQSKDYAISESAKLAMPLFYFNSNVAGKSIAILKKNG